MPGNCEALNEWLALEQQRQQQALDALNSATENAALAVATLSAATTWAASCNLLIADPPAYAICEAPALAAVAAAQLAVSYYNDKAQQASAAYNEIQSAIDTLQSLIEDCEAAEADGRQDDVDGDVSQGSSAYAAAEAVSIPEVDTQPRQDAQTAVALAEQAVEEAQATALAAAESPPPLPYG